jgi:hypothetical protein
LYSPDFPLSACFSITAAIPPWKAVSRGQPAEGGSRLYHGRCPHSGIWSAPPALSRSDGPLCGPAVPPAAVCRSNFCCDVDSSSGLVPFHWISIHLSGDRKRVFSRKCPLALCGGNGRVFH